MIFYKLLIMNDRHDHNTNSILCLQYFAPPTGVYDVAELISWVVLGGARTGRAKAVAAYNSHYFQCFSLSSLVE